jgi:phospholipid/cholesterol/gamma-HCH transport system ATP-binding protein
MDPVISIRNLRKSFGRRQVLCGVDFDVAHGETLCVIGRSGSGKSVILRHIIGLLSPDGGEILVGGERADNADRRTRERISSRFGVLFQGAALFDFLNVKENIAFGLKRKGLSDGDAATITEPLTARLGLSGLEQKMPHELSGGLQKRVGLARALALKPEIMLYDEPTTGVDPITASSVNEMIVSNAKENKMTSIVITHDMKSVRAIADRVVMLYEGRIVFSGTPDELMNSDDIMIHRFVGGISDESLQL